MTPVLIYGPTASGKSSLGMRLAGRLGASIVNADSMQIYNDLRVLSARPTDADEQAIPHRLYGGVESQETWSVGKWLRSVNRVLMGDSPLVFVGGTGLYFKALVKGLADIPDVSPRTKEAVANWLDDMGEVKFREELKKRDPEAEAKITPHDHIRLMRAMAVHEQTGMQLSAYQAQTNPTLAQWHGVVLDPPVEWLISRIEDRFDDMLVNGALTEVQNIRDKRLPKSATILVAHGLPHLMAHLNGDITLDEARDLSIRDTRQYAKRQRTWARHQFPDWLRITETDDDAREKQVFAAFDLG